MATVKTIIEKAYTKVNGEFEPVIESSDDFKTYLNALNQCMEELVDTPYVKWQIFFDMNYTLGAVVADTLSYTITNMNGLIIGDTPFDSIYFVDGDDKNVAKYKLVSNAMFQSTDNTQVATVAGNKLWLKATDANIIGTTIRIPAYVKPIVYTAGNEEVVIDNVSWLVASMSAFICDASPVPFIARNADKYAKKAEYFMKAMKDNNRRTQALIIKTLNGSVGRDWIDVMNVMTMKDL